MSSHQVAEKTSLTDEQIRMLQLAQQGFHCSEVLLFMGLDALGQDNPDLIRSVSALSGGIGFSGEACGALTGGACLLGLYAGRGKPDEDEDPRMKVMVQELVDWFSQKYGGAYGGIRCRDITEDDPANVPSRCPRLVTAVYRKARSLMDEHGFTQQVVRPSPKASLDAKRACPFADRLA